MRPTIASSRKLIWASLALVLLFNGALFAWLLFKPGSADVFTAVDNIAQTVGALLGMALCGLGLLRLTARRQGKRTSQPLFGSQRWVPLLLGLGIGGQFVGQALYTIYEQVLHQSFPFPSWADAGYLSAYPFLLLGILFLPTRSLSTTSRSRVLLDDSASCCSPGVPLLARCGRCSGCSRSRW